MTQRVVVTGLGMISPLGKNTEISWSKLINSESGLRKLTRFDTSAITSKVAGQVPDAGEKDGFDPSVYLDSRDIRGMDRFIQFGVCAAEEAIKEADITEANQFNPERAGVIMGTGLAGMQTTEENVVKSYNQDRPKLHPLFIPSILGNLAPGHIAIRHNLRGINYSINTACASGASAIGEAFQAIKHNRADIMVCGGSEAIICPTIMAGFSACRVLSTSYNNDPTKSSRPWDKNRDGFVMSEGAGVLVLESLEQAKKRHAYIYGEILGYGANCDAYHITGMEPNGRGVKKGVNMALSEANLDYGDIDYINAHATFTKAGDPIELKAIEEIFALQNSHKDLPLMSSTKSAVGHMQGASGAVEGIFSILSLKNNIAPPTLNLEEPEYSPKIDLIPFASKEKKMRNVLSNSFGFGGSNACLIFGNLK